MKITISKNSLIEDVQRDFNDFFPYLRLQFLSVGKGGTGLKAMHQSRNAKLLQKFGDLNANMESGSFDLSDDITVRELENIFKIRYGINAQVLRKSGNIWMEASITGNWTLAQQNEHGREISIAREL